MLRSFKALLIFTLPALLGSAGADAFRQRLPELSGYYLNGDPVSLPADLSAPATLLVIIEEDPGTEDLGSWREVSAGFGDEVSTLFVVVMGARRGIDRAMTAGRLRAEVSDPVLKASMVPVFQERGALRASLDIASGSGVSAVLVNSAGEVLWRARGPASETTRDDLNRVLETGVLDVPEATPGVMAPEVLQKYADPPVAEPLTPEPWTLASRSPAHQPPGSPPPRAEAIAGAFEPKISTPPQLPPLSGYTIDGQKRLLPDDLGDTETRLILVPGHGGTDLLASVLEAETAGEGTQGTEGFVLVFMGPAPRLGKAVAAGRLRGEITSRSAQARVLPIYMELSAFERLAGLAPGQGVRVIAATRSGMISETGCLGGAC